MFIEYHGTRKKRDLFLRLRKIFLQKKLDAREASIHAGSQATT
jgi:hypothetical protein